MGKVTPARRTKETSERELSRRARYDKELRRATIQLDSDRNLQPPPETTIPLTSLKGQRRLTSSARDLFGAGRSPTARQSVLRDRAVRQKLLNQQQLRAHLANVRKRGRQEGLNPKQIQTRVDAEIKKNQIRTDVDAANWPNRAAYDIYKIDKEVEKETARPSMRFKKGGAVKSSRKKSKSIDGIARKGKTRAKHR